MKTLLRLSLITALLAVSAIAQTTTVTDTITGPDGSHPSGTCSFQAARRFVSGNGLNVVGVPTVASFTAGALSVALVPTDTAISAGTLFYAKTCRAPLQTTGGANCEGNPALINNGVCTVGPFTWGPTYLQVPASATPIAMASIESDAVPPPINAQWRGAWSSAATYRVGDMVACDAAAPCGAIASGTYVSAAYANVGNSPPDSPSWWTPLVGNGAGAGLPASSAADQVLITSAPLVAGWVSIADCTASGRVLRYSTSTHSYSCPALVSGDIPDISGLYERANANIQAHIARTDNPHSVTKSQVGLANADNTSDASKPVSAAQQAALDLKASLASPTFTGTVGGITKGMVGLGNADNTSDLNKPISTAEQAALNSKEPANSNIQAHIARTDNPHSTTPLQLGLGNVDNTSDLTKPVSGPQQAALNLRPSTATTAGATNISNFFANALAKPSGAWCVVTDGVGGIALVQGPTCSGAGGGSTLAWGSLTSTQWGSLTATQWAALGI